MPTFVRDPAIAPAAAPPAPVLNPAIFPPRPAMPGNAPTPPQAPTQLQETLRRIPADIHSREATDTRRAADASRALPQVDERQEQLLRLDARKRELDEIRDQQSRLAARAASVVLSCQAIEAALAVLDRGA